MEELGEKVLRYNGGCLDMDDERKQFIFMIQGTLKVLRK